MSLDRRSFDEKRDFIRVPVDCDISLEAVDTGRHFTAEGRNLSGNGVLFVTDETLQPGDRLNLRIEATQVLMSVLDATIEVVRVEALAEESRFVVGGLICTINSGD
ncbi:PilZ domain-containing protein [Thiogranum longum]|uniref:PilZ domain-containing protein n=1 Tax=Thiogranum longum TaxID=1537524 RepID=A0A4R1HBS7_9GAMM|nr:PilZ domain-containing protein [Thiogranum longum]TCK17675.1 PilZ domain-containing protein [Thiogranum longum]